MEILGFINVNATYKIALSKAKAIAVLKPKMIAVLRFNQQDNGDHLYREEIATCKLGEKFSIFREALRISTPITLPA